jgi:hypothetical protein
MADGMFLRMEDYNRLVGEAELTDNLQYELAEARSEIERHHALISKMRGLLVLAVPMLRGTRGGSDALAVEIEYLLNREVG